MAAVTIDISSEYTDDIYEGSEIQVTDDYAFITFEWSGIDGYPEVMVEGSISGDEYADWFPIFQQRTTYEEPIKFRINDTAGKYTLILRPLVIDTYIRVKVRMNGSTDGEIVYNAHVGA